jgi:hypothetical protein
LKRRSLANCPVQLTIGQRNAEASATRLPVFGDSRAAVIISSTRSACFGVTSCAVLRNSQLF